jgi:hypothetical protein
MLAKDEKQLQDSDLRILYDFAREYGTQGTFGVA